MALRINKSTVDALPYSPGAPAFHRDSELKGFGVRVGVRSKVYFAEGKLDSRTVRVSIGRHGAVSVDAARSRARVILGQLAAGVRPTAPTPGKGVDAVTLEQAFEDFLAARRNLKPLTVRDYVRHMNASFADWRPLRITEISRELVARRHAEIGLRSPASANQAMRFLRSLLNFAIARYEDGRGQPLLSANPVSRLSQTRAWYRIPPRDDAIKFHDLGRWFSTVLSPALSSGRQGETMRDFTVHGLRRTFIAVAEGLDIPGYALARLLARKTRDDYLAGRAVSDLERLRAPMQRIADVMLRTIDSDDLGSLAKFESLRTLAEPAIRLVRTT